MFFKNNIPEHLKKKLNNPNHSLLHYCVRLSLSILGPNRFKASCLAEVLEYMIEAAYSLIIFNECQFPNILDMIKYPHYKNLIYLTVTRNNIANI